MAERCRISHRALIARSAIARLDGAIYPDRDSVAWAPMFHMACTDNIMMTLLQGGRMVLFDRFDPEGLARLVSERVLGCLPLMPGTIGPMLQALDEVKARPQSIQRIGGMADLIPPEQIAAITTRLQAPYRNTLGSTETGLAPASAGIIPIGVVPRSFSKLQSSLCELRLLDDEGANVEDGEAAVRGPSLFSGYWGQMDQADPFDNGYFRMGDMLRRNADGTLDFVDRKKYLIKSGGENIYPAEVERVLLTSPRIQEAVVVRKGDPVWREVPVAFVVRTDPTLTKGDVVEICRNAIAHYKCPKEVIFLEASELPRGPIGKVIRGALESRLATSTSP